MELKHIKELMAAMGRTGTKRLMIKKDNFELQLEREEVGSGNGKVLDANGDYDDEGMPREERLQKRADSAFTKGGDATTTPPVPRRESIKEFNSDDDEFYSIETLKGSIVKSPMVGTFYVSASPNEPPFVRVGDKISEDTVLCIIEAMKVMNEIKAGVAGTVAEVLVENTHPVEFGTPLFRVT